jgi:hypothetical protein
MARFLSLIIALLWMAAPATGQTSPFAVKCPIYDTTVLTTANTKALSQCSLNNGTYDTIFVSVVGETTCQNGNESEFSMAYGWRSPPNYPGPASGASFTGSIAGGVLTVTSMITPSNYVISIGDYLHDNQSGARIPAATIPAEEGTHLTVTGQIDGTPGGIGHYIVSNAAVIVSSETMWSLPTYYGGTSASPPNSVYMLEGLDNQACINGKTYIVNFSGAETAMMVPNIDLWVIVLFSSVLAGGGTTAKSASFNNGQMTILSPAPYTPPVPAPSTPPVPAPSTPPVPAPYSPPFPGIAR